MIFLISKNLKKILLGMKSVRNILFHRHGAIDDEIIFEIISNKLDEFDNFKREVLGFLNKK